MRQDERNNERTGSGGTDRDAHRRRFSEDQVDRAWDHGGRDADTAADGAYGESARFRAEQRAQQQRSRRDTGHDDGWGDNRAGYDNPGRYGVRGSDHEGRGGFTQDRAEDESGGYAQSWTEFGVHGGWGGNPRREQEYRTDESPWGGESWPGYRVNEGIGGMGAGDTRGTGRSNEPANARGPHAGRGPKGYRRADERITEDVCEALTRHPHVDAREIEIRVVGGEVTLTGSVDSRAAKRAAEDAAEECSGVDNVINQLRVNREAQAQDSAASSQVWRERMNTHSTSNKDADRGGSKSSSGGANQEGRRGQDSGDSKRGESGSNEKGSGRDSASEENQGGGRTDSGQNDRSGRGDR